MTARRITRWLGVAACIAVALPAPGAFLKYQIDFEAPVHQIGRQPKLGGSDGVSWVSGPDFGPRQTAHGAVPIVGRSAPGTPTQSLVFQLPAADNDAVTSANQAMRLELRDGGERYTTSFRLRFDKLSHATDPFPDTFRVLVDRNASLDFLSDGAGRGVIRFWDGGFAPDVLGGFRPIGRGGEIPTFVLGTFEPGEVMRIALQVDTGAERMRIMRDGVTVWTGGIELFDQDVSDVQFAMLDHGVLGNTRARLDEVNVRVNPEPGTLGIILPALAASVARTRCRAAA